MYLQELPKFGPVFSRIGTTILTPPPPNPPTPIFFSPIAVPYNLTSRNNSIQQIHTYASTSFIMKYKAYKQFYDILYDKNKWYM